MTNEDSVDRGESVRDPRGGEGFDDEFFRQLVADAADGVVVVDSGTIVFANRAFGSLLGYDATTLEGQQLSTLVPERFRDDHREGFERFVGADRTNDRSETPLELSWLHRDGHEVTSSVSVHEQVRDDRSYVTGIVRDVSDRKVAERRLESERELTEELLETSPIPLAIFGPDGERLRASDRARELFGEDRSAFLQREGFEFTVYDADGNELSYEEYPSQRAARTGEPISDEEILVERDGEPTWLLVDAVPVTDDDGEVRRVIAAGEDVTRLKQYQRKLERRRDELETELDEIYSRVSDAFFGLDTDWNFTYLNERAHELINPDGKDLVGERIWDEFSPAVETTFEEQYRYAMENQETVSFEEYYPPLDTWFEVTAYPSETGLSVYFRDVTDRRRLEDRIRENNRTLERFYAISSDQERSFDEKVDDLLELGRSSLDLAVGFLSSIDAERDRFEVRNVAGTHDLIRSDHVAPLSETYCRRTIESDTLVAVCDAPAEGWEGDAAYETYDLDCYLGGKVLVDDELYGTLCFGDERGREESFEAAERTFVELLTQWVGYELERERHERELRDRVSQQAVAARLGQRALETEEDIDDLVYEAARLVSETLDTAYCEVLDFDPDRRELRVRQGVGWRDGVVGNATFPVDEETQRGYTLLSAEPIVVDDVESESRFSGSAMLADHDVTSAITTVIGSPGDPWGVLGVYDTERRSFTEHDAAFLQSVAHVLATAIDRARRERDLERYETIVEAVDDGVYTVDPDGHFTMVNEAYAAMTGYDREELVGEHVSLLVDDEVVEAVEDVEAAMVRGERDVPAVEATVRRKDGEEFPAEATFAFMRSDETGYERIGVVRDVSDRKRREEELRQQNARLDAFGRMVAHELRNPLDIAKIYLTMARENDDPDAFEKVDGALDRIEEMIDTLMVVSRTELLDPEQKRVDLAEIARDTWNDLPTADATLDVRTDRAVATDPEHLNRVLANLFTNAVEHGGETVTVRIGALEDGFFVEDDGLGIPADQRALVFEPGHSTSNVGVGVGLAVVDHLAAAHDWEITITESDEGGARFEFTNVDRTIDDRRTRSV